MRSVEVEGDSIDDAIAKALAELGITRDRATIDILSDATRGILGFGRQKARVRAAVRPPLAEALAALEERASKRVSRETQRTPAAAPAARPATPRAPERAPDRPRVSREAEPEVRRSTPNVARAPGSTPPPAAPSARQESPSTVSAELVARSRTVL